MKQGGQTAEVLGPALPDSLGRGQVGAAVLAIALGERQARRFALGTHRVQLRIELAPLQDFATKLDLRAVRPEEATLQAQERVKLGLEALPPFQRLTQALRIEVIERQL